jgi:uncharacterized membrane protein
MGANWASFLSIVHGIQGI